MDPKLLTGTLEMLILDVLARADSYGYELAQTVLIASGERFDLKEGSLYPALHRLERESLLKSNWVNADSGRRRKYYRITASGKKALEKKRTEWEAFSVGVNGILGVPNHGLV